MKIQRVVIAGAVQIGRTEFAAIVNGCEVGRGHRWAWQARRQAKKIAKARLRLHGGGKVEMHKTRYLNLPASPLDWARLHELAASAVSTL